MSGCIAEYSQKRQGNAEWRVELELTRFTTREGASFDPRTAKAFLLSLEADTPHGRGVWSGRIG